MPIPAYRLSALAAQQSFYELQARTENQRSQAMLGMGGLASFAGVGLGQLQQQAYVDRSVPEIKIKKEPKNIREELQVETDEWLKDIK